MGCQETWGRIWIFKWFFYLKDFTQVGHETMMLPLKWYSTKGTVRRVQRKLRMIVGLSMMLLHINNILHKMEIICQVGFTWIEIIWNSRFCNVLSLFYIVCKCKLVEHIGLCEFSDVNLSKQFYITKKVNPQKNHMNCKLIIITISNSENSYLFLKCIRTPMGGHTQRIMCWLMTHIFHMII